MEHPDKHEELSQVARPAEVTKRASRGQRVASFVKCFATSRITSKLARLALLLLVVAYGISFEKRMQNLEADVGELQYTVDDLGVRLEDTEGKLGSEGDYDGILVDVETLKSDVEDLQMTSGDFDARQDDIESRLDDLESRVGWQ